MYKKLEHSKTFVSIAIALGSVFLLAAFPAHAQTTPTPDPIPAPPDASGSLLRDGVFGCNASKYANVGSLTAVGGVYVPVNDAAVTLNTGYLVYKECVLDGVIGKISEAARTETTRTITNAIETRRAGEALYRKNFEIELAQGKTQIVVSQLQDSAFIGSMSPNYRADVVRAYARKFSTSLNQPNQSFATTFPGSADQHRAFYEGRDFSFEGLFSMVDPCNNASGAFENCFKPSINSLLAQYDVNQRQEWTEGRGFYSLTDNNENPLARMVLTPSSVISEGALQVFTGGFRCLEGADELSEICAPLFSGLSAQLIANTGLTGLTRSQNGLPAYLDRMVQEASSAVQQEAINAALGILSTARQIETLFREAKVATANIITTAISRLRTAEATCWNLIVQNVCANTPSSDGTCTAAPVCSTIDPTSCVSPGTLRVATSTQFSQPIIDAQIAPRAVPVAQDIQTSEAALTELNQLIASVTNSASATNQRQALERLDSLVANGALHDGNDVIAARTQTDAESTNMNRLVEDTLALWGDSLDASVGWCNINSPATLDRWRQEWKI